MSILDPSKMRALESLPGGHHVAWFWEAVAQGGEGISAGELTAHLIVGGFSPHVGLDSPALFASSLRNGLFGGAALKEVARGADGLVRTNFRTPSGLRLDAHFVLDPDREHRISTVGLRLDGGGSTTAILVAAVRAAHYVVDEPKILADTFAQALSGEFAAGQIGQVKADPTAVPGRYQVAVRSRWAEDTLAEAQTEGVYQYVLLGAGLDSFAYRRPDVDDELRVFEVDQPISQSWKRRRLADIGVDVPQSVVFVPVDFETHDLDLELSKAGFDAGRPSVVAWLGVTYYLTSEAIDATLDCIARWAAGTRLVFDYCLPERLWDTFENWSGDFHRGVAAFVAASGEPYITFFTPEETEALLRAHGYHAIENLDHVAARTTYMPGHPSGPPGPLPWYQVVRAVVSAKRP
jgi:methyltransferase (TIGR00027 family)